jgi:putative membrane protein (TIGR04086 family)
MKKHKRKEAGLTALMLMGAAFSLGLILAVSLILAAVSLLTDDPTSMTGALSLVALLAAGAISGFVTSRVNGGGGVLVGVLSTVITAAVMLIISLVADGGRVNLGVLVNVGAYVAISVIAAVLGKKRVGKRKRRYA